MTKPEPKYNGGGVIPGKPVEVRIQVGERLIQTDGTILQLREVEGGVRWEKAGTITRLHYRTEGEEIW